MKSFVSDFRPETYPLCGFDGNWNEGNEGKLYNSSVITNEPSPDGKPFLRTAYIDGAEIPWPDFQYDIGVGNMGLHMPVTQGMEIFLRWIFRARNHYPGGGRQGIFASSSKVLMVGNAAGNEGSSRVIHQFRDNGMVAESSAVMLTRNIEGGPKHEVQDQEWHTYQIAIKSSSREGAADARLRMWVDNMDENSPVIDTQNETLSVVAWEGGWVRYGGYLGFEGADSRLWSPAPILDMGSFEVGDSFDSAWGTGGDVVDPPIDPPIDPPVDPPPTPVGGVVPVPIGTIFIMTRNQVYELPKKKQCTLYCDDTSAALEQSNNSNFHSRKPVALVNGCADLNAAYIRCTSGDVEALVKVS